MQHRIERTLGWSITLLLLICGSGCRDSENSAMGFKLLDPQKTGVLFNNALTETHEMNIISYPDFYSGGGVSIGDIDNDGLADIFFVGNQQPCVLYKNLGEFRFEDITARAGLANMGRGWYTGTCMVDVNADGFLDIYISKSGMEAPEDRANLLFINNGDGTFTESAKAYGLDNQGFSVNAVFFDYDKDGDLDVYVASQVSSRLNSTQAEGLRKIVDPYAGDKLYENLGNNTFVDVTVQAGLYSSKVGFAHGAAVGDINNDGWEDIFVSNDFFEYDYLYINNGDKTFTESIKKSTKHISNFSMGNDMADFNNDGFLDLVVLDMVAEDNRRLYANTGGNNEIRFQRSIQNGLHYQYMFNVLHLNNGNETFSEIGMLAGISRTDWSWAPLFADFDNDGWKDLYITNGLRKDIRNIDWAINYKSLTQFVSDYTKFEPAQWDMLLESLPSEKVVNYMYKNNGDLTFTKVMQDWGLDEPSWSNGAAFGDLDNDGDLDLVINNVDGPAFIYENRQAVKNYLRIKFTGSAENPMALGTKVHIYHGGKYQYQQHYTSRGYRSSMEPVMHFGLGRDTLIQKVEIIWPDGRMSMLNNVKSNQTLDLKHIESQEFKEKSGETRRPIFQDVTDSLDISIRHQENVIIDFIREPMLPYKLSTLGLAFDVGDVNGDGLDDFFLGAANKKAGQLYIQNINGTFSSISSDVWQEDAQYDDVGAIFFDADNDGDLDLYVVSGGNEYPGNTDLLQDRLYINDGYGNFHRALDAIPLITSSGSVVKSADFDGDGDLDLFVGGRMVPGSYPLPADSYLLRNDGGKFTDITEQAAPEFIQLGMVTDALWSDYDNDGDTDLIVVGEWMPISVFNNAGGKLVRMNNDNNGLKYSAGWWWQIEGDDIDGDGDEDYVVGNMGNNYKFHATENAPLELYYGHFNAGSVLNFIVGYHQDGKIFPTVDRDKVINQNQSLMGKVHSNNLFAESSIEEIYGKEIIQNATNKKIHTLKSAYIENKGNGTFELKPLDNYAQISSTNAIVIRDIDMDGHKDLILAGNLLAMEAETIRLDAGIGLWMRGDGKGNFQSVPYLQSGLFLDGDIRSMKLLNSSNGVLLTVASNDDFIKFIKVYSDR